MDRARIDAWLGHRPKDRRGLPIPYINRWGPEEVYVSYDPRVGRRAAFQRDAGDEVDFTRQNFQRQRECVIDGLCQVCARQVPWSRRFLPVASLAVDWVPVPGRSEPIAAVYEPWLDERCAEIATRWCPALIRRAREDQLLIHPVRSKRDVQLLLSVGSVDGFPDTVESPVAMWAKVAVLSLDIRRSD